MRLSVETLKNARPSLTLLEYEQIDEFVCENNRDYKPLFGNK
jgi:hypothetical protein